MVRLYVPADYKRLQAFYASWDLKAPDPMFLPHIGYMVDDIAAGFIYFTDSKIAIIDNFITNKQSNKEERDSALDGIVKALLGSAKTGGAKMIKCDSDIDAIKKRAVKMGFTPVGIFSAFARIL
jgi:hypothetical protein